MWAVAVTSSKIPSTVGAGDGDTVHRATVHAIAGFHDDYQALVRQADRNDLVLVPIRSAPPIAPSSSARVTLIGDAIHTMPPFGAHGANTALKDAQSLAGHLARAGSETTVEQAIGAYEAAMTHYSRPMVRGALRMMKMATTDFPLKRAVFRTALRLAALFSH